MLYIESESLDPYFNLAMEDYVFSNLAKAEPCLILWRNSKTIVVGKYQNTAEEINQEYVDVNGISVARRLSGGGAVYHDEGNLNYTLIVNKDDLSEFNFQVFINPVIKALKRLGIQAEFNGRNDITVNGRKISGSAQYCKGGRLLHHGCILLDSDTAALSNALRVRKAKIESKGVKSVRSRVATINDFSEKPISVKEFKHQLLNEIFSDQLVHRHCFTKDEIQKINRLRNEKYVKWEWNYGYFADYDIRLEKKFPAGLVTMSLQVKDARIEKIRIWGDFFGNGDISELENALVGLPLDNRLERYLVRLDVPFYMNGIGARDLFEMLMYQ